MWVIAKKRFGFETSEYRDIRNIAYDPETNVYTLTDGNSATSTIDGNNYYVFIMINQNV